jgi:hypothetical protein
MNDDRMIGIPPGLTTTKDTKDMSFVVNRPLNP